MVFLDDLGQLLKLVDQDTLEKVENTRDYVTRTGNGDLLMSFRWRDHTAVVLHTTARETTAWSENDRMRTFARGVSGTGPEQLLEFLVALSADDLNSLEEEENRIVAFEEKLFEGDGLTKENFRLSTRSARRSGAASAISRRWSSSPTS